MKERTNAILEAAVRQFIKTGQPITSEKLFDEYDFGIRPAMIRCELNELDEAGYLEQNHPSGGRWPTHKAYKALVEKLMLGRKEATDNVEKSLMRLCSLFEEERRGFINETADIFGSLIAGYDSSEDEFYGTGLSDLIMRIQTDSKKDMLEIVEDFEKMSNRIEEERSWWERESSWPQVFVGRSPFMRSKNVSVIAEKFNNGQGDFLFMMVGPTRMDYEKSLNFFKMLEGRFSENIKE